MRIAIVKLSALGDIVHAMVALQFIKEQIPDLQIDWIVEQRFVGVLENNPDINAIYTVNLKSLKTHKAGVFEQITARPSRRPAKDIAGDSQSRWVVV